MSKKIESIREQEITVKILELGCCPICAGSLEIKLRPIFERGSNLYKSDHFMYLGEYCESCDYKMGVTELVAEEEV